MYKNSLINIKPKAKNNIIKDENFSNTRENALLLGQKSVDETICNSIKKNFELKNNFSLKDKEIILKILKSYKKKQNNENLSEDEFVLKKNEINEFLKLEKISGINGADVTRETFKNDKFFKTRFGSGNLRYLSKK